MTQPPPRVRGMMQSAPPTLRARGKQGEVPSWEPYNSGCAQIIVPILNQAQVEL